MTDEAVRVNSRRAIKLYHGTTSELASEIVRNGFKEVFASGRMPDGIAGNFFSTVPMSICEGLSGDVFIEVAFEATVEEMFYEFEVIEPGKPYREFVIPASRINSFPCRILTSKEVEVAEKSGEWREYPPGEPDKTFAELASN